MDEAPEWAKQLIKEVSELKNQISINCNKLDQLHEICIKNQNSINELIKINRQK